MRTPPAGRPNPRKREPLWDRVDRNRFRLLTYLTVFAAVTALFIAAALALVAALTLLLFDERGEPSALQALGHWMFADGPWRPVLVGLALAALYEIWALSRKEAWLLRRTDATIVPKGELLPTKMALKDMAIAAGLPVAPALHVLATPNVNAFVFKAPGRRPVIGVTRGLVERLPVNEQRAVFANLIARLACGDTTVASSVASLLAPLNWYRAQRLKAPDEENARIAAGQAGSHSVTGDLGSLGAIGGVIIVVAFPIVLAGELLAALQRRAHLVAAEKADAEGMLLLKDPGAMLSALERAVRLNNNIIEADESLSDIFYCWTGDSSDDESDPEWRRVARLREVLGVEGWVPD